MASPIPEPATEPKVVFRPGKKRKAYRQRVGEDAETTISASDDGTPAISLPSTPAPETAEEKGLSVAEALRLRNARKHKLGGVGFRAGQHSHNSDYTAFDNNAEQSLVLHDGTDAQAGIDVIGGMNTRFAPQTGLVGEIVNRHM